MQAMEALKTCEHFYYMDVIIMNPDQNGLDPDPEFLLVPKVGSMHT